MYFRITEFEDRRGEEKMYLCFVYVEKDEAPYEGLFLGEEKKNIRILPNDSVVYTGTNSLSASFAEKDSPYMAEHMEFYSTKAAWQARFAGELLCDMYDSKFFLKNDVYVLWVRRTGKPGKVYLDKKDGEYVFDIRFEKFPDGEEKVYRILVTVPKEYPRIGGMLSEMKYIVR